MVILRKIHVRQALRVEILLSLILLINDHNIGHTSVLNAVLRRLQNKNGARGATSLADDMSKRRVGHDAAVKGHILRTAGEDGHDADEHVDAPLDDEGHHVAGNDTQLPQLARQAAGSLRELMVGDLSQLG